MIDFKKSLVVDASAKQLIIKISSNSSSDIDHKSIRIYDKMLRNSY